MHSTIDWLKYSLKTEEQCMKELEVRPRPNGISSMTVNNITKLDSLLKVSNQAMKILHLDYFNNNNKSIPTLNGFNMLYVFGPSYKTLKANFIAAVLYPNLPPGAA